MLKTMLGKVLLSVTGLFVIIQVVPYGHNHSNPPVRREPAWDTPQTRALAKRACFDCHSNETVWPWYSYVAPTSWLVQDDVEEARSQLNFSEWDLPQKEADEAAKLVQKGEMPLWFYVPLHPQADLKADEKQALIRGFEATIGKSEGEKGEESDEAEE